MKIFKTSQTKEIDAYTIAHEPIKSFGLMERAARCLFDAILPYLKKEQHIVVLAGSGNNGGDALVLAKYIGLLCKSMDVYLVDLKNKIHCFVYHNKQAALCFLSYKSNIVLFLSSFGCLS